MHLQTIIFVSLRQRCIVALVAPWRELRSEHPYRKCGQGLCRMLVAWRESNNLDRRRNIDKKVWQIEEEITEGENK